MNQLSSPNKDRFTQTLLAIGFVSAYFLLSYLFGPNTGTVLGGLNVPNGNVWDLFFSLSGKKQALTALFFLFFILLTFFNKKMFRMPILLFGLTFFCMDAWESYAFYHVNTYKMVVLWFFVVVIFLQTEFFDSSQKVREHTLFVWLLLFLAALAAFPGAILEGFQANYNFIYELSCLFALSVFAAYIYSSTQKKENLHSLLHWLAFTMIFLSLMAIQERYSGSSVVTRVKITFGNVTYFATYIITLLPIFFCYMFQLDAVKKDSFSWRRFWVVFNSSNWLMWLAFALGCLTLYFTQTRASLLGFFVSGVLGSVIFVFSLEGKAAWKYLLIVLGVISTALGLLLAAYFFLGFAQDSRLLTVINIESYHPRFVGWIPAVKAFLDNPIFGSGLGSSYNLFFDYFWKQAMLYHYEMSYNHTHNEFLQTLEEGGLLGFVGVFGVVIYLLIKLLMASQTKTISLQNRFFAVALISGIVASYVDSLFSISLRQVAGRLPLYLLFGVSFSFLQTHQQIFHFLKEGSRSFVIFSAKKVRLAVLGLLGVVIGSLFGVWAYTQYQYIASSALPVYSKIERMKEIADVRKDIYLLDDLTGMLLNLGRYQETIEYGNMVVGVTPYYRINEAKIGHAYFLLSNFEKAHEHYAKQRSRNPYITSVNSPFIYTSLVLNKKQDFLEGLRDGFAYLLIQASVGAFAPNFEVARSNGRLFYPGDVKNITVEEVEEQPTYYDVQWSGQDLKITVRSDLFEIMHSEALNAQLTNNKQLLKTARLAAIDFQNASFLQTLLFTGTFSYLDQSSRQNIAKNLITWLTSFGSF